MLFIIIWWTKLISLWRYWWRCFLQLFSEEMGLAQRKIRDERANRTYVFRKNFYEEFIYDLGYPTSTPLPRSGHRIVCNEKNLYSYGGYNPDQYGILTVINRSAPLFRELWQLNLCTGAWKLHPSSEYMPDELASNAVIRIGDMIVIHGGTGYPFGRSSTNSVSVCNLDMNSERDGRHKMRTLRTSGNMPTPQYGQAIVYHNHCIYTIGGTEGFFYSCDIHRLNLNTLEWEAIQPNEPVGRQRRPSGRYRHELAFDGKCIYLFGGGTAEEVFEFDELTCYNVEKNAWEFVETIPDPNQGSEGTPKARRCHGLVQLDTADGIEVYISGGYDGRYIFNDLWRLNLKSMRWYLIESCKLPKPTYFHSTAVTPAGKMYVFGGITHEENGVCNRRNEVHTVWLKIPALSEMCWEALLQYTKVDASCDPVQIRDNFASVGVPRKFLQRIE